jgi:DNA-binding CsgD family transcriptional regulator
MSDNKKYKELRTVLEVELFLPDSFFSPCAPEEEICIFALSCIGKDQLLYLDDSFQSLSGHPASRLVEGGMDFWFSLMHPEDRKIVSEKIVESHKMLALHGYDERNPRPMVLEYRAQHAGGEWIWIRDTKYLVSFSEKVIDKILGKFERIGPAQITDVELRKRFEDDASCTQLLDFALAHQDQTPPSSSSKIPRLTKREKEILRLIGEGCSTKMIADRCNISINTVETHRRHLLEKLEVNNSMQLIKEASKIFWL